ncbi:hypothetical protein BDM02DRAFT_3132731 [Thelephora ganbajun]|uniref:Uncharacterized protein n=1 Tax=Thelephora ganbajun TaxID=370292 RepID=A0ACB6Z0J7_THEGA|nr:hypothetical protein BDM02DRAFT_3132731 [Thelephora ganbajun]
MVYSNSEGLTQAEMTGWMREEDRSKTPVISSSSYSGSRPESLADRMPMVLDGNLERRSFPRGGLERGGLKRGRIVATLRSSVKRFSTHLVDLWSEIDGNEETFLTWMNGGFVHQLGGSAIPSAVHNERLVSATSDTAQGLYRPVYRTALAHF